MTLSIIHPLWLMISVSCILSLRHIKSSQIAAFQSGLRSISSKDFRNPSDISIWLEAFYSQALLINMHDYFSISQIIQLTVYSTDKAIVYVTKKQLEEVDYVTKFTDQFIKSVLELPGNISYLRLQCRCWSIYCCVRISVKIFGDQPKGPWFLFIKKLSLISLHVWSRSSLSWAYPGGPTSSQIYLLF